MKLRPLEAIVNGFIMAVGITRPTPKKRRVATIFIASGLIGSVLGVTALFLFLIARLS
jgi:hypothetical protein